MNEEGGGREKETGRKKVPKCGIEPTDGHSVAYYVLIPNF